jgi:hypothetical protein
MLQPLLETEPGVEVVMQLVATGKRLSSRLWSRVIPAPYAGAEGTINLTAVSIPALMSFSGIVVRLPEYNQHFFIVAAQTKKENRTGRLLSI